MTPRELTAQDLFNLCWKWHKSQYSRKITKQNRNIPHIKNRAIRTCRDDLLALLYECGFEDKTGVFKQGENPDEMRYI